VIISLGKRRELTRQRPSRKQRWTSYHASFLSREASEFHLNQLYFSETPKSNGAKVMAELKMPEA